MFDVTVVLMDDGLSSTAIVPVEIFHSAGRLWQALHDRPGQPAFRIRTVSVHGGAVRSPYGIGMTPETTLEAVERTDVVIVPSSGLEFEAKLVENSPLLPWLLRHYEQGALIAGVCMGAAYLAETGLLDARLATTHWALADAFAARYPKVFWRPDRFVTEDQRLLCSGGVYAAVDASLYLVEKLCGHETAVECAKALLLPMPRVHQSGYAMAALSQPHGNGRIRAAEAFLQENLARDLSLRALAAQAGMGERTFARQFKEATGRRPSAYHQALRIEAAKAMLERDALPVQSISARVGYDDVAFFRSLFKRTTGMTPAEYRAHFAPLSVRGEVALAPGVAPREASGIGAAGRN